MRFNSSLRISGIIACIMIIKGCATATTIGKPQDIADTGKSNVVLMSFEIIADVFNRHPSVTNTSVGIKCGRSNGNLNDTCFQLNVPFKGLTAEDDTVYQRFARSDVKTFKIEYGDYPLKSIAYRVVHSVIQEPYCYTNKKNKQVCTTREKRDYNSFRSALPDSRTFSVKPGNGCYIGHLKLRVVANRVVEYTIDPTFNDVFIEKLPDALRDATRNHVTESCLTG